MEQDEKNYAPIKVTWMMADTITKLAYFQTEKAADEAMADYQNRKKGIAVKLYRSQSLGKYVVVPENPNTIITHCIKCGNILESDECDDCGYYND